MAAQNEEKKAVKKTEPITEEEAVEKKKVKKTTSKATSEVEEETKKSVKKVSKKTKTEMDNVDKAQEEVPVDLIVESKPENHTTKAVEEDPLEISIERKLVALYTLQQVDSKVDEIRAYRGNLPLEVQDLEDEVAGLETRIGNHQEEKKKLQTEIANYKIKIQETTALIDKFKEQQNNVRNNREYDSLSKEIEYQELDIQLSEKRIREATAKIEVVDGQIQQSEERLNDRRHDLKEKQEELKTVVEDTEKEEAALLERSKACESLVEDRLLVAYKRIRKNARNGLAVVGIQREACAGCFNKVPPQHQLDICTHKKIIVCEYCGRILVDKEIIDQYHE